MEKERWLGDDEQAIKCLTGALRERICRLKTLKGELKHGKTLRNKEAWLNWHARFSELVCKVISSSEKVKNNSGKTKQVKIKNNRTM
jgi:hypothetical protein